MKISIVTISFNQCQFLKQCMDSVISQRDGLANIGVELEYIVVDPGSTDGSRELIETYENQIIKLFEKDNGPTDGLNNGFRVATGEVFGYINSDDAYLPGALVKVVKEFKAYASTDVVCGHGYIVDQYGEVLRRFYSDKCTPWRYVHSGSVIMQQSTFFRRSAFEDVNGFNLSNPIWWDGELMLDFAMMGKKITVVNDFWSVFTMHEGTISSQRGKKTERAIKLDIERKQTHARLYRKATGNDINKWTTFYMVLARLQKWILQPEGTFWMLIDKVGLGYGKRIVRK